MILVGLAHVFYSLFLSEKLSVNFSIFNLSGLSIPLVYSFGSLIGVFLLLLSAPLGFATMFDEVSSKLLSHNREVRPSETSAADDSTILDIFGYRARLKSNPESSRLSHKKTQLGEFLHLRSSTTVPNMLITSKIPSTPKISRIRRAMNASAYPLVMLILLLLTVRLFYRALNWIILRVFRFPWYWSIRCNCFLDTESCLATFKL